MAKIIICPICGVVFSLEAPEKQDYGTRIRDDDGFMRDAGFVERCPCGCDLTQEQIDNATVVREDI